MTTIGFMTQMTECIWNIGKCCILDSGFCVLQGIVELQKKGLYSSAVIKKRRYWPAGVKGDDVINHFKDKEIGSYDALPGELDSVPFNLVCIKEKLCHEPDVDIWHDERSQNSTSNNQEEDS